MSNVLFLFFSQTLSQSSSCKNAFISVQCVCDIFENRIFLWGGEDFGVAVLSSRWHWPWITISFFSGWVFGWTLRYKMDFENARITTHRSLRKIQVTQLFQALCAMCIATDESFVSMKKKNLPDRIIRWGNVPEYSWEFMKVLNLLGMG